MKRVGQALLSPWFLYPLGAVLLSLLVWFLPPLVGLDFPASEWVRLGIIVFIVLLFSLLLFLSWRKRRKADKELVASIATVEVDPTGEAISSENKQIQEKLKTALADLRQTLGKGGQSLYQLPWYAIIGPPGAGKTTALLNSGLRFPLAERHGAQALQGVGGTRNCDWWFTEKAVLLDTAGRWTTQDSDAKVDQAAWTNFLGVLKRTRERQPLNGILVVFGVPDLLNISREDRVTHARAIRTRLLELQVAFGLTLPIYVVLTKLDMIAGFVEFFDDLDREGREQVLGLTFPLGTGNKDDLPQNKFSPLFDRLVERQRSRLLDRLQSERDLGRRTLIYGFPSQFASLGRVIDELLGETFNDSRFASRLSLRGVYFTSATQQGSPIDRLMDAISGKFGIQRQALPPQVGQGRGFFLRRLFDDVVFNEAGLVGTNPKVERRNAIIRYSAFAATALVLLTLAGLWTWSYIENADLVKSVEARVQELDARMALADKQRFSPNDIDPRKHLALLNDLRRLPTGYDHQHPKQVYLAPRFGLGQDERLGVQTQDLYHRGLVALLLPRLLMHAQKRLGDGLKENPTGLAAEKANEALFETLKAYLLLGEPTRLRKPNYVDFLEDWFKSEFEKDGYTAGDLISIVPHVRALAAYGIWDRVALDEAVIAKVQNRLAGLTMATRALKMLERSTLVSKPAWRVIDAVVVGRSDLDQILMRKSGESLTADAVPFLYTRRGYLEVLMPTVTAVTAAANMDSWVLNESKLEGPEAYRRALDETLKTYFDRYNRYWLAVLQDVRARRFKSTNDGADILTNLEGPLRSVYVEVARQTMLTAVETLPASVMEAPGRFVDRLRRGVDNIVLWAAVSKDVLGTQALGRQVEIPFQELRRLTGVAPNALEPTSSPIIDLLKRLKDFSVRLTGTQSGGDAVTRIAAQIDLEANKREYPADLRELLSVLAEDLRKGGVDLTREQMENLWNQTVYPFCRERIANRFPVSLGARQDIALDEFVEMFGANKRIDKFTQSVEGYLDKGRQPWQWKANAQSTFSLSPDIPPMLQRAKEIREAFLGPGGSAPDVRFTIIPGDQREKGCTVEFGSDLVSLEPDARRRDVAWSGARDAKVACGSASESQFPGQWAVFRLMNSLRPSGSAMLWQLTIPGGFSMRVDFPSDKNPLSVRPTLGQFQCVPFTPSR